MIELRVQVVLHKDSPCRDGKTKTAAAIHEFGELRRFVWLFSR